MMGFVNANAIIDKFKKFTIENDFAK